MNKEFIYYCLGISVALIIGGRYLANALFPWIENFFMRDKRSEASLDELIQSRLHQWGKSPRPAPLLRHEETIQEAPPKDPVEEAQKIVLQRIFHFNGNKKQEESEEAHALRILGLNSLPSPEQLRQAFKAQAKLHHPDTYPLQGFDTKLKKRLVARIHQNYIVIQKAHDTLKKKRN